MMIYLPIQTDINYYNNYDSLKQEYTQKIEECKNELNQIIATQSEIDGYDYSKHLDAMGYEKLFKTYMPEKLRPVGFNTRSPADAAIRRIALNEGFIKDLEDIRANIDSKKWWLNFSN